MRIRVVQSFGIFFHQIKVRQLKEEMTKNVEIRWIFVWSSTELFSKIQVQNKKTQNFSGLCSFLGLSNGTILMQIQTGRTVPLNVALTPS
jgi:hypothetical protein